MENNGFKSSIKEAMVGFSLPKGLEHAIESLVHGLVNKRQRREGLSITAQTSVGYFEDVDIGDENFDGWFIQVVTMHDENREDNSNHEVYSRLFVTQDNVLTGRHVDLADVQILQPDEKTPEEEQEEGVTYAAAKEPPPARWLH